MGLRLGTVAQHLIVQVPGANCGTHLLSTLGPFQYDLDNYLGREVTPPWSRTSVKGGVWGYERGSNVVVLHLSWDEQRIMTVDPVTPLDCNRGQHVAANPCLPPSLVGTGTATRIIYRPEESRASPLSRH
jgi:hypothetical protein